MSVKFIAVRPNVISWSSDGISWTNVTTSTGVWASAVYGAGKWVVMGYTNVAYSTDGTTWSYNTLPPALYQGAVCYGGGKFVAVPQFKLNSSPTSAVGLYSSDGITWSTSTLPSSKAWVEVAYGNGRFIAIANDGTTAYSTNGTTWTAGGSTSAPAQDIASDGSAFVIIGATSNANTTVNRSTNGVSWTTYTLPATATWEGIAYGDDKYVAIAGGNTNSNQAAYSTDGGITWTSTTLPATLKWNDVTYSNGMFVAITGSSTNASAYSTDGITWTSGTLATSTYHNDVAGMYLSFVASASSTSTASRSLLTTFPEFTASAIASSVGVYASLLIKNVTGIATAISIGGIAKSLTISLTSAVTNANGLFNFARIWDKTLNVLWASTKWIGTKANSTTALSCSDGTTWTSNTLPASVKWSSIASTGALHLAVAANTDVAATSTDGTTWTSRTMPASRVWIDVAASASTFVAIAAYSSVCATSTDGITWTEHSLPQAGAWASIAYNGTDTFCVISADGYSATSTDSGVTWTLHLMPDVINYTCVTWGLGQFTAIASGPTQLAAKSTDGVTWVQILLPASAEWTSISPGIKKAGTSYVDSLFVIANDTPFSASTIDGTQFELSVGNPTLKWSSITGTTNGEFLFISTDVQSRQVTAAYSITDGATWNLGILPNPPVPCITAIAIDQLAASFDGSTFETPIQSKPVDILYLYCSATVNTNSSFSRLPITYYTTLSVLVTPIMHNLTRLSPKIYAKTVTAVANTISTFAGLWRW